LKLTAALRSTALLVVPACQFTTPISATTSDAHAVDAPGSDAPDASNLTCRVGAGLIGSDEGQVGLSTGGGRKTNMACLGSDRITGIALYMSQQPVNGGDTDSAQGIRIACAPITIDHTGGHTGAVYTMDDVGSGGAGFTPAALTALASCADGASVTGMQVYGSHYADLMLSATIYCTGIAATGKSTTTVAVPIAGSGTDTMNPSMISCPADDQIVTLVPNTGAGLDSVEVFCAPTQCD
jgi:hypothetical protein